MRETTELLGGRHMLIKGPWAEHFNSKEPPDMVLSLEAEKSGINEVY